MKTLPIFVILACSAAIEVNRKADRGPCQSVVAITCDKWFTRALRQVDLGPFWANRGKREPKYLDSKLFAEVPHWVLVRRDGDEFGYDPFFTARGKRNTIGRIMNELRHHNFKPFRY